MGRIERGEQSVSLDKIWDICEALNTTPEQIFHDANQLVTNNQDTYPVHLSD